MSRGEHHPRDLDGAGMLLRRGLVTRLVDWRVGRIARVYGRVRIGIGVERRQRHLLAAAPGLPSARLPTCVCGRATPILSILWIAALILPLLRIALVIVAAALAALVARVLSILGVATSLRGRIGVAALPLLRITLAATST